MNAMPSSGEAPVRAFVALHVPAAIQQQIAGAVEDVRNRAPEKSVRWVRPENIHLTLRFIGTVSPQDVAAMKAAIQRSAQGVEPFAMQLSKAGCFPGEGTPRVLWMGLVGDIKPLRRLQLQVTEGTDAWCRAEDREFYPHLTLGRVTTRRPGDLLQIANLARAIAVPRGAPWQIDAVHLMQSVLAPGGSEYLALASFPLVG